MESGVGYPLGGRARRSGGCLPSGRGDRVERLEGYVTSLRLSARHAGLVSACVRERRALCETFDGSVHYVSLQGMCSHCSETLRSTEPTILLWPLKIDLGVWRLIGLTLYKCRLLG